MKETIISYKQSLNHKLINFLSPNSGIINTMLNGFGIESINFMSLPSWFRTIYVSSSAWQSFGFGSIIDMSAITSINQEIYESASIDGAGRLEQIWHSGVESLDKFDAYGTKIQNLVFYITWKC